MKTRRGTAIAKVPPSKCLVPRMFGNTGSGATFEDWFDSQRTGDDCFPTGLRPYSAKSDLLKGHPFESFEKALLKRVSCTRIPVGRRAIRKLAALVAAALQ
jgi:hypothetical protein